MEENKNVNTYYPPFGFLFKVNTGWDKYDASFQEVSGLEKELELEEITEGGLNNYKHRLPKHLSYTNLVLKRGLVVEDSGLGKWVREILNEGLAQPIKPKDFSIDLMDPGGGKPLMTWNIVRAYPVKWSVSGFKSDESSIITETLEFAFQYFNIKTV